MRQPGPLQNFAAGLGIAEQEPHQGTLGRIGDRQRDDSHVAALEPADDVHQLADAVFQEHGELADRRIVAAAHRGEFRSRSRADSFTQYSLLNPLSVRSERKLAAANGRRGRMPSNPVTISIYGTFATRRPTLERRRAAH